MNRGKNFNFISLSPTMVALYDSDRTVAMILKLNVQIRPSTEDGIAVRLATSISAGFGKGIVSTEKLCEDVQV